MALARYIFDHGSNDNVGVLPTPAGVYAFSAAQVRNLLAYIQELWAEGAASLNDAQLRGLLDKIACERGDSPMAPSARALPLQEKAWRILRMLGATGLFPHRFASRVVPANAIYLNIGQLGLAMPSFFNWLSKRPDVTCAMMVHDAIPIDYPHLVGSKAPVHHKQMIRTAAEHADCMIFNSAYTRDSVNAVMRNMGAICPPALVRSLPLPAAFADADTGIADLADTRYFLAVSTVEPRKNFALLLRVWQRLIASLGKEAPHLVIVGSPGRGADSILAPLRSDAALAGRVHHVAGLSSPALASLLSGAAGMLCPSLAEGFGLPLLEANALGVTAIASDIPAHREVATATTTLLAVDDEDGWVRAIAAAPDAATHRRTPISVAMTEAAYCADIINFVGGIHANRPARI